MDHMGFSGFAGVVVSLRVDRVAAAALRARRWRSPLPWRLTLVVVGTLAMPTSALAQGCTAPDIGRQLDAMVPLETRDNALDAITACEGEAVPGLAAGLGNPNPDFDWRRSRP